MTLADAIRKGAMQRGQARWILYDPVNHTSCVLGALLEGVFGTPAPDYDAMVRVTLREMFPQLVEPIACPSCQSTQSQHLPGPPTLTEIMVDHLNDQHGWTREQIADWLDTLPPDLTKLFYGHKSARLGGLLPDVARAMKRQLTALRTRLARRRD